MWPGALWADDVARVRLSGAYWRRRRLEAKLLAVELARVLAGSGQRDERMSTADAAAQFFGV